MLKSQQIFPRTIGGVYLIFTVPPHKGYFAENFIAQEFICAGMENLYSWKENTAKIEFLMEKNGSILPVEVKSGWITQAKSLKVFDNKYHPEYKIIMSANNLKMNNQNQTLYCPLYNAYQLVDYIVK